MRAGTYAGWDWYPDVTCASGYRWGAQLFRNGLLCGASPRETWVNYTCATNGLTQILSVSEPITCKYQFVLAVECNRNTYAPNTLCVPASATPTPSITASGTRTPTVTPTATKSYGTSDSASPSATNSLTASPSSSPTVSFMIMVAFIAIAVVFPVFVVAFSFTHHSMAISSFLPRRPPSPPPPPPPSCPCPHGWAT